MSDDHLSHAPCFALVRVGKISPMRIHTPGAQVIAYPIMNMQALKIHDIHVRMTLLLCDFPDHHYQENKYE
jgi:hypothetical protein